MAIVIPRSRSSGALSIWSKAVYLASCAVESTLVIAAVSVVLPWSMCPIVPTFTCGFVRTNFCFAMSGEAPPAEAMDAWNAPILCSSPGQPRRLLEDRRPAGVSLTKTHKTAHYALVTPAPRSRNGSGTVGARDGNRTRDPNLTKIVLYL